MSCRAHAVSESLSHGSALNEARSKHRCRYSHTIMLAACLRVHRTVSDIGTGTDVLFPAAHIFRHRWHRVSAEQCCGVGCVACCLLQPCSTACSTRFPTHTAAHVTGHILFEVFGVHLYALQRRPSAQAGWSVHSNVHSDVRKRQRLHSVCGARTGELHAAACAAQWRRLQLVS